MIIDSQHLGRDDNRLAFAAAGADQLLLDAGHASSGISTPRSPRATISASGEFDDLVDALDRLRPFRSSNIRPTRPLAILRTSARSSGRWMKESATQSTSLTASPASEIGAVLVGQNAVARMVSGS